MFLSFSGAAAFAVSVQSFGLFLPSTCLTSFSLRQVAVVGDRAGDLGVLGQVDGVPAGDRVSAPSAVLQTQLPVWL